MRPENRHPHAGAGDLGPGDGERLRGEGDRVAVDGARGAEFSVGTGFFAPMGSLWTQKVALNGRHPSHLSVTAQKIALQGTHHIKKAFPNGNAIIPKNKKAAPRGRLR